MAGSTNISIRMEKSPFEGLIPEDWESSKKRDPVGAQCTHFILMILYLGLTIGATVLLWIFVKDMVFRLGLLTGVLFVGIPCIRREFEEQKEVNQLAADRLKEERERKKN